LVALLHKLFESPVDGAAWPLLVAWPPSGTVLQSLENMRRALVA
jgi:hypothetical protein